MLKTQCLEVRLSPTDSGGSLPAVKEQVAHSKSRIEDTDGLGRLFDLDALSRDLFLTACRCLKIRLGKISGFLLADSRCARSDRLPGGSGLRVRFQGDADAVRKG